MKVRTKKSLMFEILSTAILIVCCSNLTHCAHVAKLFACSFIVWFSRCHLGSFDNICVRGSPSGEGATEELVGEAGWLEGGGVFTEALLRPRRALTYPSPNMSFSQKINKFHKINTFYICIYKKIVGRG